jgi:GT2 family glycosyltransferase
MSDLTISIVNYKTKELTAECLNSILNKKIKAKFKIFLVDNNSNDGSIEFFKKNFPQVNLIKSDKNLGFAGGHNLVLRKLETDLVLLLNSDTLVNENAIDEMVEFMDKDNKLGIASCKILNQDGSLQPNAGDFPKKMALINWLFNLESFGIIEMKKNFIKK